MSEPGAAPPPEGGGKVEEKPSFATRYALAQKAGGIAVPLLTVILAFLIGGLVVLATTGKNPLTTYQAIFEGAGMNWFLEVGSYELRLPFTDAHVPFPWNVDDIESLAAYNLQQTLIAFVPLVLTGLAVAFAFRCGMFNIGGQGQYLAGAIMGVWVGSELPEPAGPRPHPARGRRRHGRGRPAGRHRRDPEGDRRHPRGDLDDHAQLDHGLDGRVPVRARRAAPERYAAVRPGLERRPGQGEAGHLLG